MQVRLALAAATACLLGLAWTAPAFAGTAFVQGSVLKYEASSGETNAASVVNLGADYFVTENGSTLGVGAGCTLETQHTARCPAAGIASVAVSLGDLDDQLSAGSGGSAGYTLSVDMGSGNDSADWPRTARGCHHPRRLRGRFPSR